jgi:hypothetical protein
MTTSTSQKRRTVAVGAVLPVHNEECHLPAALDAVTQAFAEVPSASQCGLVLVLDACDDTSAALVRNWVDTLRAQHSPILALVIETSYRNVGAARRLGCEALLRTWDGIDVGAIWIATTDADSLVPSDWFTTQLKAHERGVDLWSGRVCVQDWSDHHRQTAIRWNAEYEAEHHPIHGTSLGFNAERYLAAGGFPLLRTGEDRALYEAMASNGANAHHETNSMVVTSARRIGRAPCGFSSVLLSVEDSIACRDIEPSPHEGTLSGRPDLIVS